MKMMNVLTAIVLALSTSSCSLFQTKYVEIPTPILPPDSLLQDCLGPESAGKTWADLVEYAIDQKETIEKCNIDKKALRDLKESYQVETNE